MKISANEITIIVPDNWHCHFRQEKMRYWMVQQILDAGWRGRVKAMPNTVPPILTCGDARYYRRQISDDALMHPHWKGFDPVMTIQITEVTTPEMIFDAWKSGVRCAKIYPLNVTTNSSYGVFDYIKIYPALRAAQECGMIVSFHGEHPSYDVEGQDKEKAFLEILSAIAKEFPRLKIILEHITTESAVVWILQSSSNVAATITVHHLLTTYDDVMGYSKASGGKMNLHLGCKPQPKRKVDMKALRLAAVEDCGSCRFFYGGDDASHLLSAKHDGSCGVFNTPVAMPLLIQLFEEADRLPALEGFTSCFGAGFHGMEANTEMVTFVRKPWRVPAIYPVPGTDSGVVPMFAGRELQWQIAS